MLGHVDGSHIVTALYKQMTIGLRRTVTLATDRVVPYKNSDYALRRPMFRIAEVSENEMNWFFVAFHAQAPVVAGVFTSTSLLSGATRLISDM